ncbi:hypothetical protein Tsubulata_008327 [Turnera subulata]|uniref:3'-5' exonuclease domain-containing protein n=1 Tax=Turnera subulata TaxID=218843 RepID=A0A9Q0FT40_9ROSI|nr:hypothetical protein Tsubulata_008327 [Turnera subulata]
MAAAATSGISIKDYQLPDETHNEYDVTFFDTKIHTLVTHTASVVDQWLHQVKSSSSSSSASAAGTQPSLMIGLDIEWRPSFNRHIQNPVATLQLSVASHCLIFQLVHCPALPPSLAEFLGDPRHVFVGVGIESDAEKLLEDHELLVRNTVDLGALAAERLGEGRLRGAGLKQLAKEVLGKEVSKPKQVTMSRWDNPWLTPAQVKYASLDAILSFLIGKQLNALPN